MKSFIGQKRLPIEKCPYDVSGLAGPDVGQMSRRSYPNHVNKRIGWKAFRFSDLRAGRRFRNGDASPIPNTVGPNCIAARSLFLQFFLIKKVKNLP